MGGGGWGEEEYGRTPPTFLRVVPQNCSLPKPCQNNFEFAPIFCKLSARVSVYPAFAQFKIC